MEIIHKEGKMYIKKKELVHLFGGKMNGRHDMAGMPETLLEKILCSSMDFYEETDLIEIKEDEKLFLQKNSQSE